MRKLSIPNDEFFSCLIDVMSETEEVTFLVKGHSMFPFLRNEKDKVCIVPCDETRLRKGDVLLFRFDGRYVLHRIVGKVDNGCDGNRVYVMRGDGNVEGEEFAMSGNIYGIMTKRITPSGKEWRCSSISWRCLSSLWAFLSPIRRILLALLRRIYR